jgi:hypothetical protein
MGTNEAFEGGVADLSREIVSLTDHPEGCLGLQGKLFIVDKSGDLLKVG